MAATVPALVVDYIADRIDAGMADSTALGVQRRLCHFHRVAGPPAEWTAATVLEWANDPRVRPDTRKSRRYALRGYTAWLTEHGHVPDDVALGLGPPLLVTRYVTHRQDRGEITASTAATLAKRLRQFHERAGRLSDWSADTVTAWVSDPTVSRATRRARRSDLAGYTAWLTDTGRDTPTPAPARRRDRPDLVSEYLERRLRRGEIVASSAEVAAAVLGHWHRHAGDDLTAWTLEVAETWAYGPDLKPATRRARLNHLRGYTAWLVTTGRLSVDITDDLARVRVPKPNPRDLTVGEVRELLAACPDDRARLIVLTMTHCGLRVGDLCRARVEDVDRHRRVLAVRGKGGFGEPTHWVPIPDEPWRYIAIRLDRDDLGPWLVCSERIRHDHRPMTPNAVSRLVRTWLTDAGLRRPGISSHSLRHSCAQHLLDHGADIRQVQAALGHSSVTVTEQYLRRQPPGLAEAMAGRTYLPD